MSNNSNNRPIALTAAGVLAAILAGGGGALLFSSQPQPDGQDPTAIEAPANPGQSSGETLGAAPATPDRAVSESSETTDSGTGAPGTEAAGSDTGNVAVITPDIGSGEAVGGPGEGVDSIAGKDAMILPEKAEGPSVYWVGAEGNRVAFEPEKIALSRDESPNDALEGAIAMLLDGEDATAIPPGTELLSLKVEGDDVHIDLSGNFIEGGGTASMAARMGQVIYTTTAMQPDAQIWLSVDGELLEMIGGEGLIVDQPLTEERFARDFNL